MDYHMFMNLQMDYQYFLIPVIKFIKVIFLIPFKHLKQLGEVKLLLFKVESHFLSHHIIHMHYIYHSSVL